jgi:hypothetical protein
MWYSGPDLVPFKTETNMLMKKCLPILLLMLLLNSVFAGKYTFSVKGEKTFLNDKQMIVLGLRCSNALMSDTTTNDLIHQLDNYKEFGINTVSVYFQGSRFGNIKGYNRDGSLNPIYANRMAKIIEAADDRGMVVLVGCLYWGNSQGKWEEWKQAEANAAVANTVKWLGDKNYRNVFIDVDNEGMAQRIKNFNNRQMVLAGKSADSSILIATNFKGGPPAEVDLAIHFANPVPGKPYIQSEASPKNAPGRYWGKYSKKDGYYNYINIGIYNPEMKQDIIKQTIKHVEKGWGYMLASTWLQCPPPYGPNAFPGGDGSKENPGIQWWLDFVNKEYGEWILPE